MPLNNLEVKYVDIETIKPYKNNAKQHPKEQIEQIKKSIQEFGMIDPIGVWNNEIVEGHGRLIACQELGIKEVPIIRLNQLTDEQRRAYALIHNQLTLNSENDPEIEAEELEKILDIDMSDYGFDINLSEEEQEIVEDEVPEVPEEPKSKLGDMYQLGNHRLMCGDSTNKSNIEKLLDGNKVDLLFTDPPYNMHYSGMGIIPENERVQTMVDFDANSINWLSNTDFGSMYIFTSKDLIPDYLKIFKNWKFNILIWEKTNNPPLTMNTFLPDIEYLLYFHNGKRIWNNSLKPMEIYKKVYSSSRQEGQKEIGNVHPTMKPINLICDKLKISSNENSVVLDLFGGSGSTLIACEQLNRKCYMIEYEPKNPKVAVEVLIGHGHCKIIIETSVDFKREDLFNIVYRITRTFDIRIEIISVPQDKELADNQKDRIRCGDNGIFKGMPLTEEQKELSQIAREIYSKYKSDGKYILDKDVFICCQSNAKNDELKRLLDNWQVKSIINPLGEWTGGINVDTGATNRKLGSDMADSITGGGLHGKDLSKADVSVNIYAFLKAQETGKPIELCCAIGDEEIDGKPYSEIVEIAKQYIKDRGGFEKFAEWGLY